MPQAPTQAALVAGEEVLGRISGALDNRHGAPALVVCDGMPEELVAIPVQLAEHNGFRRRARLGGLPHALAALLAESGDPAGERFQQRDAFGRGGRRAGLASAQFIVAQAQDAAQFAEQRLAGLDAGGPGGRLAPQHAASRCLRGSAPLDQRSRRAAEGRMNRCTRGQQRACPDSARHRPPCGPPTLSGSRGSLPGDGMMLSLPPR